MKFISKIRKKADFFHSKISKIFPYFYKSNFLKMYNFDEYLRQGEPNKAEKAKVWKTAIGLQQVDSLKPSEYLIETAKQNIEGEITISEVKQRIDTYYKQHPIQKDENRTEEADKVSARIAEILGNKLLLFRLQNIWQFTADCFKIFTNSQGKFAITILPNKNGC